MASLPPRKNTPNRISRQPFTPLQTLLQMGFSRHRAEKALASTGWRNVQLASDWLLAHVNDPTIDEFLPREYILYLCPTGLFLQQLEEFWSKSKEICGWNGAHNFLPHITLVSFFKAPDECAPHLAKTLKQIVDMSALLEKPLKLELYTSGNFMGFFVSEHDANFLKRIALQYVKEVSNSIINDTYEQLDAIKACFPYCGAVSGNRCIPRSSRSISLEPHVKSLHLTLAYQFPQNQYNTLKALVENLDPNNSSVGWELRLYSRDSRLSTKEVHKVIHSHIPRESDELELRIGDYLYLNSEDIESADGWIEGISWLTGCSGYLPKSYAERTSESEAWTMHKSVTLYKSCTPSILSSDEIDMVDGMGSLVIEEITSLEDTYNTDKQQSIKAPVSADNCSSADTFSISERTIENASSSISENRKIFIMRHGERVDFTFGIWTPYCFDEFNSYVRKDLNMPKFLPKRKNCPEGWQNDSPLTNIGLYQAQLIGEAMKDLGIKIDHVYCSPSYRCVQTCNSALEGLSIKLNLPLSIEPGLFEWMAWYQTLPDFCTPDELIEADYNINKNYAPFMDDKKLENCLKESTEEFYQRNYDTLKHIIQNTTGNIFIVGHAATLDTTTRQLTGKQPRTTNQMRQVIHKIPYCSLIVVENISNEWKIVEPICLPVTHSKNTRFEWNVLAST